jgi:hypothetical protein
MIEIGTRHMIDHDPSVDRRDALGVAEEIGAGDVDRHMPAERAD